MASFVAVLTLPIVRDFYLLAFSATALVEAVYAMQGKFFYQECMENKIKINQYEKRLEQLLEEAKQLVAVDTLTAKNVQLNEMGLKLILKNVNQCRDVILQIGKSDVSSRQKEPPEESESSHFCLKSAIK